MTKKKNTPSIKNWQKFGLVVLIVGTLTAIKFAYFSGTPEPVVVPTAKHEPITPKVEEDINADTPRTYVNVFFIGQNESKDEVYRVVRRKYSPKSGDTKLKYSIKSLLKGPTKKEKAKGIYSEVPQGTKLLSLEETPTKVTINLSGDFEQGGGTDGLYKRLYQLIKTANKNTTLDVYLFINGKQVDVVGGEGIMINQPLNEKSLDE